MTGSSRHAGRYGMYTSEKLAATGVAEEPSAERDADGAAQRNYQPPALIFNVCFLIYTSIAAGAGVIAASAALLATWGRSSPPV